MKLNIIKLVFLSMLILAVGCTGLDSVVTDSILVETDDGTFSGDPEALLETAYSRLGNFTDQQDIFALLEHSSDEMIGPTRGTDWSDNGIWRVLHAHTWEPTHAYVLEAWNELNSSIFVCNQVLASSPSTSQEAQARFLRAFYMFYVMDLYGQVPFREVNEGSDVDPKVLTRTEAFNFIIEDLETALPDLAEGGPADNTNIAYKSAAYALLAKLTLNKVVYTSSSPAGPFTFSSEDMDKVIEYCDQVTAAGYALGSNDYFEIFTGNNNQELIFTIESDAGTPQNRWAMTLHYSQDNGTGGWNGFTTLASFYNKFEADEQRIGEVPNAGLGRGFLVGQQFGDDGTALKDRPGNPLVFTPEVALSGNNERSGIRVIKYHRADAGDYILLRYADVYLMKIEAILRGGTAAESAQDLLDDLRTLRGASSITADLNNLLDERGRELYWEGWRRNDQIRFETFNDTWEEKTVTEAFRVLYPIPQSALDTNPNLDQNDGY